MPQEFVISTVIAVVALLLIAAAAAIGLRRLHLPFTVGLVVIGIGLRLLVDRFEPMAMFHELSLSPEIILFVFLPTLIFEAAFNLDSRLLSRNLKPVLILAAPGLLISTALVGAAVAMLTPLGWGPALLFGALISATDPVAVIALFKEVGAPKRLAILVEGESLFNDATAIVLFRVILGVLGGGALTFATVGDGALKFVIVFMGGLLIGGLIGYAMVRSIALADDDPLVEVALSTVVAYAAFIAAEHYLHVSGVMATVGAGVAVGSLGSTRFTPRVREYLHQFWEFAAFVANSLIFLLVGLTVSLGALAGLWLPIMVTVAAALVVRAAVVFGLIPLVGRLPGAERIGWRYQSVMFWGGLRGAVALALVLSLPEDFAQREIMITLAIGVVLFSLLTGGLSIGWLIRVLGLAKPTLDERVATVQATIAAKREALRRIRELATAGHYSPRLVQETATDYERGLATALGELGQLREDCQADEIRRVLWTEALTVEHAAYRDLFGRGAISEPVMRELELAVELERDRLKTGDTPKGVPAVTPLEVRMTHVLTSVLAKVVPKSSFVRRQRLRALAARYEHDLAVFKASRRVVEEIDRLAALTEADDTITDECRQEFRQRSREAMKRIDTVAEHFPEYVDAVQLQTARRIALDGEADAVNELADSGAIPATVARQARRSVEIAQRELSRQPVGALEHKPQELLAQVPFFQDMPSEDLGHVVDILVPRTVLAGEEIIRQGEHGTSLFLIARGVVAVRVTPEGKRQLRVASLHAGDFFGEMALLTSQPRTATVEAVTDCQLYELAKRDVDRLCETRATIREALESAARDRGRSTDEVELPVADGA